MLFPIGIFILTVIFMILYYPLMRSEKRIRNDILKYTPIGLSMVEVLSVIENKNNWILEKINEDRGYINYDVTIPNTNPNTPHDSVPFVVGEKSIRVYLGKSWTFGHCVQASWGFDKDGKLIDVYVRKTLAI